MALVLKLKFGSNVNTIKMESYPSYAVFVLSDNNKNQSFHSKSQCA